MLHCFSLRDLLDYCERRARTVDAQALGAGGGGFRAGYGEAEKGISAHPTQSVAGALLVGILIGRLLGRR